MITTNSGLLFQNVILCGINKEAVSSVKFVVINGKFNEI